MDKLDFFRSIPFFSHLPEENLHHIADSVQQRFFNKNDLIFREGEQADGMYIILFGEVEVAIGIKVVARLGISSFFGEIALITDEPRSASVGVVSDNCSTLFLSKEAFDKIKYRVSPEGQKEILRRIYENKQRS